MDKTTVLNIVDACFHMYASDFRRDAKIEAERLYDKLSALAEKPTIEPDKALGLFGVVPSTLDKELEQIEESQREAYLHDLKWQENMSNMYNYGEDGFCDGFTRY